MSTTCLPTSKVVNDPKKKLFSEKNVHKILEEFDLSEGTSMQDSISQHTKKQVVAGTSLDLEPNNNNQPMGLDMIDEDLKDDVHS